MANELRKQSGNKKNGFSSIWLHTKARVCSCRGTKRSWLASAVVHSRYSTSIFIPVNSKGAGGKRRQAAGWDCRASGLTSRFDAVQTHRPIICSLPLFRISCPLCAPTPMPEDRERSFCLGSLHFQGRYAALFHRFISLSLVPFASLLRFVAWDANFFRFHRQDGIIVVIVSDED